MNKLMIVALSAVGLGAAMHPASAATENGGYFGIQYNAADIDFDVEGSSSVVKTKFKAATILGGKKFNKYIAIEGRVGTGIDPYEFSDSEELKISTYFSLLARGSLPISNGFNIYGVFGYTSLKIKDEYCCGSVDITHNGATYGVGIEAIFADKHALSLEYIRLQDGNDNADGISVDMRTKVASFGYRYHFD